MDKTLKREELATLLRSLSAADMAWLRQRLLRRVCVLLPIAGAKHRAEHQRKDCQFFSQATHLFISEVAEGAR